MELKGIDAKLFTLEPESPLSYSSKYSVAEAAMKRGKKYPGDLASAAVAFYDDVFHRQHQLRTGKISVASFPGLIYGRFDGQVCSSFLHLLTCYKKEKSLDKMPWSYPEVKRKLRASAQTVEDNRFVKCLVRLLKSLAIAAISAGVFLLLFWLLPKVEPASGLEFFMGLATVVAVVSCLAFSLWSVILLLGGFGPSKQQRQDLANAYIGAMRYIRYRILWYQEHYELSERGWFIPQTLRGVPPYLVEAEKELRDQVKNVQDVLRRELGEDWIAPTETVGWKDVDSAANFLADMLHANWLLDEENKKALEEISAANIKDFGVNN